MNQAVANRLLRLALTVEAADGKLDEVLALLRPIATPVGVIRTPEGWGDTPPPAPGPPPPGLGLTEPGSVSQWGKIHPPSEETQRAVGEHIVERLSSPVLLDWRGAPHGAAVLAALHEFGYEVEDGTGAGDAVRAALHAERRARDAANIDAGEARAEAGLRLRERDDAREDAAMWRSHTEFLARVFPGGPVEITRDGQCVTIANTPGRRRWWGRRRR